MQIMVTLRNKIFFCIIIINIIAILLISLFFYAASKKFLSDNYARSLASHNNTIIKNIDDTFQKTYYSANRLSFDSELQKTLHNLHIKEGDSASEQKIVLDILKRYKNENDMIDSIYIFLPQDGQIYTERDWLSLHADLSAGQKNFFDRLLEQNAAKNPFEPLASIDILNASQKKILTYLEPIKMGTETLGWVLVNLDERSVYYKYLDDLTHYENAYIFLLDGNFDVVSGANVDGSFTSDDLTQILTKIKNNEVQTDNFIYNNFLIIYKNALFGNYHTIMAVNTKNLMHNLILLQAGITCMAFFIILASFIPSYYLAKKINKPLEKLEDGILDVSNGNFKTQIDIKGNDEISRVSKGFNSMVKHINKLINQIILEKTLKKEAELKALQYQITPHFIYNTLNSIRFAAIMQGAKNIGALLEMFIQLLQVSSDKRGTFITLREEIKTLKNYVNLQKFRHGDKFAVDYDLSNDSLAYIVPRLILQPLVENSIMHAPSESKPYCHIKVSARCQEDLLMLIVEDDGRGISLEKIREIQETGHFQGDYYSHIGIKNIKDRLRLYYDEKGELYYESDGETFTKAILKLPLVKDIPKKS